MIILLQSACFIIKDYSVLKLLKYVSHYLDRWYKFVYINYADQHLFLRCLDENLFHPKISRSSANTNTKLIPFFFRSTRSPLRRRLRVPVPHKPLQMPHNRPSTGHPLRAIHPPQPHLVATASTGRRRTPISLKLQLLGPHGHLLPRVLRELDGDERHHHPRCVHAAQAAQRHRAERTETGSWPVVPNGC